MSDDLISRQAAIEACLNGWNYDMETIKHIQDNISRLPSVKPKTGRWKELLVHRDDEGDILRDYECTNCLGIICDVPDDDETELPRFCCMCGAKMEGIENE